MPDRRSLPPMEATEFAIEKAFRHCLFALGLVIGWSILLLPLIGLAWFVVFRDGPPDMKALPPVSMAALGALAVGLLLASFSIGVNWNRRILLGERPTFLARWRLDGVVWRYIGGVLLLLLVLAVYGAIGAALMTVAAPALSSTLGAVAKPLAIAVTVLVGLSALFTLYRLMSWLPGLATGEDDYTLAAAWRTTRGNRLAFLALTFWLLFSLAVAGGLGAGAFFAQQSLHQPWVKPAAPFVMGAVGFLSLLMLHSVPAALHRAFRS